MQFKQNKTHSYDLNVDILFILTLKNKTNITKNAVMWRHYDVITLNYLQHHNQADYSLLFPPPSPRSPSPSRLKELKKAGAFSKMEEFVTLNNVSTRDTFPNINFRKQHDG